MELHWVWMSAAPLLACYVFLDKFARRLKWVVLPSETGKEAISTASWRYGMGSCWQYVGLHEIFLL